MEWKSPMQQRMPVRTQTLQEPYSSAKFTAVSRSYPAVCMFEFSIKFCPSTVQLCSNQKATWNCSKFVSQSTCEWGKFSSDVSLNCVKVILNCIRFVCARIVLVRLRKKEPLTSMFLKAMMEFDNMVAVTPKTTSYGRGAMQLREETVHTYHLLN